MRPDSRAGYTRRRLVLLAVGGALLCALPTGLVLLLTAPSKVTRGSTPLNSRSRLDVSVAPVHVSKPLVFAPGSVWNARLAADTPIDPRSAQLVAALVSQTHRYPIGIATSVGGVPIYTVPRDQPRIRVALDEAASPLLQEAFDSVPLPADAEPAAGPDHTAVVYQPSSNTLWEFWHLVRTTDGFHAGFGGRMIDVSQSPGYYRNVRRGGRLVERSFWGAPAAKVSLLGGVITIADLESGSIDHALAVALPEVRAGVWSFPAQASDGTVPGPDAIPEGARFRLPANLDIARLNLPPLTRMIALAAQRYGIIVINRSTGVAFRAQDPTPTGHDPYYGATGVPGRPGDLFSADPSELLRVFPWSRLQLVQMHLSSSSS